MEGISILIKCLKERKAALSLPLHLSFTLLDLSSSLTTRLYLLIALNAKPFPFFPIWELFTYSLSSVQPSPPL
jgi:hypothetical protein